MSNDDEGFNVDTWGGFAMDEYAESSIPTMRSGIRKWLGWCDRKRVVPEDAEKADLLRYIDWIRGKHADTTISSYVNGVRRYYWWADSRGYIDGNPFAGFELAEELNKFDAGTSEMIKRLMEQGEIDFPVIAISKERVERLFDNIPSPRVRNELLVKLFWQTGVRADEMYRISRSDVDTDERSIRIVTSKTEPGDDNHIRYVWWRPSLDFLMNEWIEYERPSYTTVDDEDSGRLFVTTHKPQMTASYMSRIVKQSAFNTPVREEDIKTSEEDYKGMNRRIWDDAAGKNRWLITAHTMRRSYITHCANHTDIPIHLLAKLVGHKKLETTLGYVYTDRQTLKGAAQSYGPE